MYKNHLSWLCSLQPLFQLLVTTKDSVRDENFLLLLDFPTFNVTYRLSVSWLTKLVTPHMNQETIMVLEGSSEDVLLPDVISRMRVGGICEGVPEARLARLLKRSKFQVGESKTNLTTLGHNHPLLSSQTKFRKLI